MRKIPLILMLLTLLFGTVSAQRKVYDYNNLTPEQIEEIKKQLWEYHSREGERKESAIKRELLNQAIFYNANQANYDVRYYGIHVSINFPSQTINAYIDYRIKSLVNGLYFVDLDLHDQLIVDSAKVNGIKRSVSHFNHTVTVNFPTPFSQNTEFGMTIYYHGTPYSGYGYTDGGMGFWSYSGYNVCWTATEPFASRNWWPCKDTPEDKADSIDLYIECPSNYDVAANGIIVSNTDIGGGRRLFHYKHKYPIVTYLVALTCADFDVTTKTWNYGGYSMPVYSYTLPIDWDSKNVFDTLTLPVLNIYSDAFGIYPFVNEKLGNANCGPWGTMEHQTCSFHESFSWYDPVYLLIHENAHQWWGDMITCKTFHHIWLNEGFGTYSESIFYEGRFGPQAYFNHILTQEYLGGGTIYVEDPLNEVIFDGNLSYYKGAWVVHMLRGILGDSLFFKAIKDWTSSSFRYGSATTEDFTAVLSNSVGTDMNWFVHQWIYGDGHPDYRISWECKPDAGGGYDLSYFIEQLQGGGTYFSMPIGTRFVTTAGNVDTVLWNEGAAQFYTLSFADSVTNIIVDPQKWILRTVQTAPFSMHAVTRTMPNGTVGQPYYQQLLAVGGILPYHWTYWGGDLPYGLTFTDDTLALISGTPTYAATFYFTIRLTDSSVPADTEWLYYTLTVDEGQPGWLCGDPDASGFVDVSDVVYLVNYIFTSGPAPAPMPSGDPDCSGTVDISDAVYLVSYVFASGPPPCAGC